MTERQNRQVFLDYHLLLLSNLPDNKLIVNSY